MSRLCLDAALSLKSALKQYRETRNSFESLVSKIEKDFNIQQSDESLITLKAEYIIEKLSNRYVDFLYEKEAQNV